MAFVESAPTNFSMCIFFVYGSSKNDTHVHPKRKKIEETRIGRKKQSDDIEDERKNSVDNNYQTKR